MQRENKPLKQITNNTGASLVFVLAVMLLLLTLGVSALVASSANASAVTNKQLSDQLTVYADSVQKSIMYSLQTSNKTALTGGDNGKNMNNASTLGGQILREVYKKAWADYPDPISEFTLDITPTLSDGTDLSVITSVAIKFTSPGSNASSAAITPLVHITPTFDEELVLLESEETITIRHPQTAAIRGTATVAITVAYRGKTILSVVTYDFTGGFLEDDGFDDNNMLIKDAGTWRFDSYDTFNR